MRDKMKDLQNTVNVALDEAVFANGQTYLMTYDAKYLANELCNYVRALDEVGVIPVTECVQDYLDWWEAEGRADYERVSGPQ